MRFVCGQWRERRCGEHCGRLQESSRLLRIERRRKSSSQVFWVYRLLDAEHGLVALQREPHNPHIVFKVVIDKLKRVVRPASRHAPRRAEDVAEATVVTIVLDLQFRVVKDEPLAAKSRFKVGRECRGHFLAITLGHFAELPAHLLDFFGRKELAVVREDRPEADVETVAHLDFLWVKSDVEFAVVSEVGERMRARGKGYGQQQQTRNRKSLHGAI